MKSIMCPHLKGSRQGAVCSSEKKLIKDMEDINIRLCMNRHYEVCPVYMMSLQRDELQDVAGKNDVVVC
ncbi:MAG: hypothetical protein EHM54_03165 [Nitrospiraceae bacterium]|nr:MAG: hypothetical protein EHM54_03165 [Nitrospiraceae bacterium]